MAPAVVFGNPTMARRCLQGAIHPIMAGPAPAIHDFCGINHLKSRMADTTRVVGRAFGPTRGPAMTIVAVPASGVDTSAMRGAAARVFTQSDEPPTTERKRR